MTVVTDRVRDAATAVQTELGPGLRESAYQDALSYELSSRGVACTTEVTIPVLYKDVPVARMHPDLAVGNVSTYLVELKVDRDGLSQLETYLRYADENDMEIGGGVLIVFGESLSVDLIE